MQTILFLNTASMITNLNFVKCEYVYIFFPQKCTFHVLSTSCKLYYSEGSKYQNSLNYSEHQCQLVRYTVMLELILEGCGRNKFEILEILNVSHWSLVNGCSVSLIYIHVTAAFYESFIASLFLF